MAKIRVAVLFGGATKDHKLSLQSAFSVLNGLSKEKYDIKAMYDNYEKQRKAFTFSYGNYEIVIPQTPQDIIREGAEMHHCVGGYVNDVVKNKTYIVFVRNKSDLTVPYITAQVKLDGELGQYYLAYDRHISSVEDREFKDAFQEHLRANWVIE